MREVVTIVALTPVTYQLVGAFGDFAFERTIVGMVDRNDDVDTRRCVVGAVVIGRCFDWSLRRVTTGYLLAMLTRAGPTAILASRVIPVTVKLLCDCSDTDDLMETLLSAALRISSTPACQRELGRVGSTVFVKISLWSDRPTLQELAIRVVSNLRHCADNVTRFYKLELQVGAAAVRADWAAKVDAGAPRAACSIPPLELQPRRVRAGLPAPLAEKLSCLLSALDEATATPGDLSTRGTRAKSPTRSISPPLRAADLPSARARARAAPVKRPASAATVLGARLCSGGLASLAKQSKYTSVSLPAKPSSLAEPSLALGEAPPLADSAPHGAAKAVAFDVPAAAGGGGHSALAAARASEVPPRPQTAAHRDGGSVLTPSAPLTPRRPAPSPRVRPQTALAGSTGARLDSSRGRATFTETGGSNNDGWAPRVEVSSSAAPAPIGMFSQCGTVDSLCRRCSEP